MQTHCYQREIDDAAATLRGRFTPDAINHALRSSFANGFKTSGFAVDPATPTGLYIEAISTGFYDAASQMLPSRYRECAVVALLASQGDDVNLAYHLFLALMANISANDVYDILLLTGVYAGVNRLTSALNVAHRTFNEIIDAANQNDKTPADVLVRIKKAVQP